MKLRTLCTINECEVPSTKRGLCAHHYGAQWRAANADRKKAADAAWRAANREKLRADAAEYRKTPQKAAADRRWRQANRASETRRRTAWDEAHPDALKERMRAVRAKRRGAFVEKVDMDLLWLRDKGTCGLCHMPIDPSLQWPDSQSLSLDHVVPLSRGGTHEPANAQLAHLLCNTLKGSKVA